MLSTRYVYLPQRLEEACYVTSGYGITFFFFLVEPSIGRGWHGVAGSEGLTKWGRGGLEPVGFALR
jgi:hypothetical protein